MGWGKGAMGGRDNGAMGAGRELSGGGGKKGGDGGREGYYLTGTWKGRGSVPE